MGSDSGYNHPSNRGAHNREDKAPEGMDREAESPEEGLYAHTDDHHGHSYTYREEGSRGARGGKGHHSGRAAGNRPWAGPDGEASGILWPDRRSNPGSAEAGTGHGSHRDSRHCDEGCSHRGAGLGDRNRPSDRGGGGEARGNGRGLLLWEYRVGCLRHR